MNLKDEVKDCAERMGYHWAENTDPDVPCAGLMYQENVMIAVSAKKVRYGLSENCIIENKFPDDIENVRALPLRPSSSASSGSGRRTSGRSGGSMSCRGPPRRSRKIPKRGTGTPITGRCTGRKLHLRG